MNAFEANERLLRLYGRDSVYDAPLFRVVWSEHILEKREGEYEDITPAGIYLGTKTGIREVPKYWYFKPCWVLEKFEKTFTRGVYDEVKEPFMYEPLYVFLDKNDNNLPLAWFAIEYVIGNWLNAEKKHRDLQAEKQEINDAQVERNLNLLHADDPKEQPTFKTSVSVKAEVIGASNG